MDFFSFLNGFWAIFDFCPFELLLILALFITRFYGVLLGFIGFLAFFLMSFEPFFYKKPAFGVFFTGFLLGWALLAIPEYRKSK